MNSTKDDIDKKLEELAAQETKKRDVASKKLIIEERRVNNEMEKLVKNDKELAIAQASNFGSLSKEQIEKIQVDSYEYIHAARNCMRFINKDFDGIIPYFRKNLILVGGKTGEGKSTTVSNIAASTLRQINPDTGERCKVLVITNEEKVEDVYNRITCYAKGWSYTNHDRFTDEQIKTFNDYIPVLAKDGWLTVIDDSHGSTAEMPMSGVTTSLEGIKAIFDNLIANKQYFSAICIDYYQNVKTSKKNPSMNEWEVQAQLAALLDQYKNIYPAPIVLMAQVAPPNEENTVPFKYRIEGRKSILNVCTACIEMVADRENLRTEWLIHKSRFNESVGSSFKTGYDKGRFVEYTPEFQTNVIKIKERQQAAEQDKTIGIKPKKETENE